MKDTIAEAEAVRAKYREDLARKAQEEAKKKIKKKTIEGPEAPPLKEGEKSLTELAKENAEKPPAVSKKIFDKVDEKRKKKAKKEKKR